MSMILERSFDAGNLASLHRELLAAGFFVEPRGDGASLVLAPRPYSGFLSPSLAPTHVEEDAEPLV